MLPVFKQWAKSRTRLVRGTGASSLAVNSGQCATKEPCAPLAWKDNLRCCVYGRTCSNRRHAWGRRGRCGVSRRQRITICCTLCIVFAACAKRFGTSTNGRHGIARALMSRTMRLVRSCVKIAYATISAGTPRLAPHPAASRPGRPQGDRGAGVRSRFPDTARAVPGMTDRIRCLPERAT
jgi:hypothetical protein